MGRIILSNDTASSLATATCGVAPFEVANQISALFINY
jgi:hypothetical protein